MLGGVYGGGISGESSVPTGWAVLAEFNLRFMDQFQHEVWPSVST